MGPRGTLAAALAASLLAGCLAPQRAARLPPLTEPGIVMDRDEKHLWREAAELDARARKSDAVLSEPALQRYLLGLVRKLTPRAAQDRLDVRVRILESSALTAFVTPDGCIFVSMGLLARLDNEAQLSVVLGHELVHAINRHAIVEYRTLKSGAALSSALPFSLGELGTKAAVTGYSRDLEVEADAEGLALAAAGGWDVREAPRTFQHLATWVKEERLEEPFFFSTHPRLEERIGSVTTLLATRYADRNGGEVGAARYRAAVREVVLGAARLDLAAGRFDAAERGARDYLELTPRSAKAWALLGDVARQRGDPVEALTRYRKAVALDPGCPEGQRGLGQALARRGDAAAARAALQAYLKLRPDAVDRAWIDEELARLPRSGR
jgi:predicted Zn-dependent protease